MGIAASMANGNKTFSLARGVSRALKVPTLKAFFKVGGKSLVEKWQGVRADRQHLWRVYDESSYAHSMPKCVWRRHGALLMYAQYHKPGKHP